MRKYLSMMTNFVEDQHGKPWRSLMLDQCEIGIPSSTSRVMMFLVLIIPLEQTTTNVEEMREMMRKKKKTKKKKHP